MRGGTETVLREKFRDLDADDLKAELSGILADENLGLSEADRQTALGRARTQSRILTVAGSAVSLWAWFYPHPYDLVFRSSRLFPAGVSASARWSHGLVTLDRKMTRARPTVVVAVTGPASILGLGLPGLACPRMVGILDALRGVWRDGDRIGPVLRAGAGTQESRHARLAVPCLACLQLRPVIFLNCALDRSVPDVHRTVVVARWYTHGKSTSHYLRVDPWIDGRGSREIMVARSVYDRLPEGSPALIWVRKGCMAIPWFVVRSPPDLQPGTAP